MFFSLLIKINFGLPDLQFAPLGISLRLQACGGKVIPTKKVVSHIISDMAFLSIWIKTMTGSQIRLIILKNENKLQVVYSHSQRKITFSLLTTNIRSNS